jgi:hypothetical protein
MVSRMKFRTRISVVMRPNVLLERWVPCSIYVRGSRDVFCVGRGLLVLRKIRNCSLVFEWELIRRSDPSKGRIQTMKWFT